MNFSVAVEEAPRKQSSIQGGRSGELRLRTPPDVDYPAAVATFGILLYRYTGLTSVTFDVVFGAALDSSAPRARLELDFTTNSTLASVVASVAGGLLQRHDAESPVVCIVPLDLCRFFQRDRTAGGREDAIAVIFSRPGQVVEAKLQFRQEVYEEELVVGFARHLEQILEAATGGWDAPLSEYPMMTADELHRILVELNGDTIEFERATIPDAFEVQVNKTPDAAAIKFNSEVVTYRELHHRASEVAVALQRNGVEIESLVGVYAGDPITVAIVYLGIVIAGGVIVPLDPEWPPDRLQQVIQNAKPGVIVTTPDLSSNLPHSSVRTLMADELLERSAGRKFVKPALTADNAAYIVHTSGSTDVPKGVVGLHRTITSAPAAALPAEKDEVFALSANLSFGAGVIGLFFPLIQGAGVLLVPASLSRDLPRLVDAWERANVTRIVMVAPQLRQLCLLPGISGRLKKVRTITLSGAVLNADLLPEVYALFPQATVTNSYTCIEVGTMATRWVSPPGKRRLSVTVGSPLPNIRVYVLGPEGTPVPLGMPGEIYVGSADLSRGYLNQAGLSRARFLPNPFPTPGIPRAYRTGDIGRLTPDGELEYLGRLDNQVKVRGIRVELEEIELGLHAHPDIQHAAVVAQPHENEPRLIAFVVSKPERTLLVSALREHLASRLPSYCIPSVFVIADQLPLTRNGKIDRQNLPRIGAARPEMDTPFVAPRNAPEKAIQAVWQKELGFEGIGVNDHFLELGGDSLLAVRVAVELEGRLGVELPVVSLFEFPTIAQLAAEFAPSFLRTASTQ